MEGMTKGEARTLIRDAKKSLAWAERQVSFGDVGGLHSDIVEAARIIGRLIGAVDLGEIEWKKACSFTKEGGQKCRVVIPQELGRDYCEPHQAEYDRWAAARMAKAQ